MGLSADDRAGPVHVGVSVRMSRDSRAVAAVLSLALLGASPAGAEQLWVVRSGQVTLHLNVPLLRDLGLEVVDVQGSVPASEKLWMEEPNWTFAIRRGSDLRFRTVRSMPLSNGLAGGAVRVDGTITVRDRRSGRELRLGQLEIANVASPANGSRQVKRPLILRSGGAGGLDLCDLLDSMLEFDSKVGGLRLHYLNARINESWARAIGRSELSGRFIGIGEVRTKADLLASTPDTTLPSEPNAPGVLDLSLGLLTYVAEMGREGEYPGGLCGLSVSTTACNVGSKDVPWLGPMQEAHPLIHMALYRLLNGRFEQIGVSWIKHGFEAASDEDCSTCRGPTNGTALQPGCSDTYGVGNNSDRNMLGPRKEVNGYAGTWECTGSHFAGGLPDCIRRHGAAGHGPIDHRLVVADADLGNPGATYFYEACYLIPGDQNLTNNWGSRMCMCRWDGSGAWQFDVPEPPVHDNYLVYGPALARWGELNTYVNVAPGDGQVLLSVQTTDLGGGVYHYEYALLNRSSDRQIRSFSLPINGVQNLANIGFHDSDYDPTDDWQVTAENGTITWQTQTYAQDPNAHALEFGIMHNFRFDAFTPGGPTALNATLGLFKPGTGTEVTAATRGPANVPTAVGAPAASKRTRLIDIRPNPTHRGATVSFELEKGAAVKLDLHDAAGRIVRMLLDERRGPGVQAVSWDGRGESGERVRPGVYYARLISGGETAVKSVVIVN